MEEVNSSTGQLRPNQARCAASAIFFPHSSLMFTVISFCRQEGNPDFFIAAIVISVWILRAATGGRRGGGTTRCPCWQRCIKTVMSHPISQAHLCQQRGFLCSSVFSFTAVSSLPPLFASSLSLLTLLLSHSLIRRQHYTDQDANWLEAQCL